MFKSLQKAIILVLLGIIIFPSFAFAQTFNDPYIPQQWYLNTLKMNQVWDYTRGAGQVIAVIDAGVDTDHPDLINNIWTNQKEISGDGIDNDHNGYIDDIHGWDFVDGGNNPYPHVVSCPKGTICDELAINHATVVSGIIAAEAGNGLDVAGLAPEAKIMPIRALDTLGSGSSADVIKGIDYAIKNGATIINMSFAGTIEDPELNTAIEKAYNAGLAVVVAAGNKEGTTQINLDTSPRYPICSRGTLGQKISFGVGSHDESGMLSDFSNYGSSCLDLIAPGDNITGIVVYDPALGFIPQVQTGFRGTSLAAPMVSGAIALIRSYRPGLSLSRIYQLLRENAGDVSAVNGSFALKIGAGALDILNIMTKLSLTSAIIPVDGLSFEDLVKSNLTSSVYYYGTDGKRYVFPDGKTYLSWYPDFSLVKTISPETLALIPFGGVVNMRPGTTLLKVTTSPQVYAVDKNGTLRWIANAQVAQDLYGDGWAKNIKDLQDAFFFNYHLGADINSIDDYSVVGALNNSRTISSDKGL